MDKVDFEEYILDILVITITNVPLMLSCYLRLPKYLKGIHTKNKKEIQCIFDILYVFCLHGK